MAAKLLPITDYLTSSGRAWLDRQAGRTYCGQAHFAVGPECCSSCALWGYSEVIRDASGNGVGARERKSCRRFHELTGQHGPRIPGYALACRHYQKREA
jgi:hypothetical protein